jgi:hypothetical protein
VCEVKIFLPLKKGTIVNAKHKHVSGSHFLSLPLSFSLASFALSLSVQIFRHFSLWFEKKEEKKIESNFFSKKRGFFQESHHFLFLTVLLLRGIILSLLRVYSKERVGEKGEDKRV